MINTGAALRTRRRVARFDLRGAPGEEEQRKSSATSLRPKATFKANKRSSFKVAALL
jgi:hypothetical protein